ncbi:hypothetical protein AB0C12_02350 [Actinoplanes sp. NPDC048967]|uniref:hypothetical protein n=1 Tax=Actinoplanes sp. NPDC048967 TaxID=3155269 RepID=UPI0033FE3D80
MREREWRTWSLEKWTAVLSGVVTVLTAVVALGWWVGPVVVKKLTSRAAVCGISEKGRVLLDAAWLTVPAEGAGDPRPAVTGSCNSRGGGRSVSRRGPGSYEVILQDLGVDGGTVEVTAVSGAHRVCGTGGWGRTADGVDLTIRVTCVDGRGARADSGFAVRFLQGYVGIGTLAYLRYELGTTSPFIPDDNYSFNSFHRPNSVKRLRAGVYVASLQGVQRSADSGMPGVVKVTPVGDVVHACNPTVWDPHHDEVTGAGWMQVEVECFDAAGAPVDSRFALSYSVGLAAPPGIVARGAQLWSNQAAMRSFTPNPVWQFSSAGPLALVERRSAGDYVVKMPAAELTRGGHTQVSAYHTAASCHPDAVPHERDDVVSVRIRCWSRGAPADARFSLLFQS